MKSNIKESETNKQPTNSPWSKVLVRKLRVHPASPDISRLLRNNKVHYRANKSPPPVPITNKTIQFHIIQTDYPNGHFNLS